MGLSVYGWSGRFIEFGRLRELPSPIRADQLQALGIQPVSLDRDASVIPSDALIATNGWLSPRLWGGRPVQPVQLEDGKWVSMFASSMLEFKNYLTENGIVFCYSGYMTEDILHGIGSALKKKLDLEEVDRKVSKAAFAIFVEQVQNIIRYSAETVPQGHAARSERSAQRHHQPPGHCGPE